MECKSLCFFTHHPKFIQELEEFINNHVSASSAEETINNIERLLVKHFYDKDVSFTPKHFGMAQGFNGFEVYWLHMVIPNSGLSRTQVPKAYFYKNNEYISFLCLDSHIQNYKDAKLRKVAEERLREIIEVLKTRAP
ncbi:MAG: hypothetical protein NT052_02635 [Candidatus Shapirobacteria bacterium]|nr:hypothetical protein [Candidatus Shapirobacteria bacterium]